MNAYLACFFLSFLTSLVLTPFLILLARRLGHIAYPDPRGWHQKPTPLLGGAALLGSFLAGLLWATPNEMFLTPLVTGSILSFFLGLMDDISHLKPFMKLVGQILIIWWALPSHDISHLFFVVLMMNSFNLLDNIDGLAAGVSCLIALGLVCLGAFFHQNQIILPALALSGATAGFLLYNFHPAKIFMGDAGSLFLGFCLASQTSILLVPSLRHGLALVLFLAIPLADTLFVICSRAKRGKSIVHGGQDHLSHWLLSLGLSPSQSVLTLYLATSLSSVIALWLLQIPKG